ncbi:hypothetical protein T06_10315 [Trichinella sp. T6]|nr:hypothetical protein T06_10315 [Trichinella sp. T6]
MSKKQFPDYRTMTEERLNGLAIMYAYDSAIYVRIRKSMKAAKSNNSCSNFIKYRVNEGIRYKGGGLLTMLGAEMEVRVEEGGESVLSISVLLGRKLSYVSL